MKIATFIVSLFISLTTITYADYIIMKDGTTREGKILYEDDKKIKLGIIVSTGKAIIEIEKKEIKEIKRGETERELKQKEFNKKFSEIQKQVKDAKDVDKLLNLAKWARENRLISEAYKVYKKILEIDPENEIARKKLGYVKYKGKWMTFEEKMKAMGKVFFRGYWIDEEVRDEILKREAEALARSSILSGVEKNLKHINKPAKREINTGITIYEGYLLPPGYIIVPYIPTPLHSRIFIYPSLWGRFRAGNWDIRFWF